MEQPALLTDDEVYQLSKMIRKTISDRESVINAVREIEKFIVSKLYQDVKDAEIPSTVTHL